MTAKSLFQILTQLCRAKAAMIYHAGRRQFSPQVMLRPLHQPLLVVVNDFQDALIQVLHDAAP